MATQQIWSERKVITRALGFELASLSFFLNDDTSGQMPNSLSLQMVARVAGVQIGESTVSPLKNGNVQMPMLAEIGGTLDGRVDDYRALDPSGASTGWNAAVAVGFQVTALGDVTVPVATVAKFVPVIGPLLSAAFSLVGGKVTIALAHEQIIVHLPRTA